MSQSLKRGAKRTTSTKKNLPSEPIAASVRPDQQDVVHVVPEALQHFDALPDAAYVRQPVVEALYACSAATVWRGVKAGRIPAPARLSPRIVGWNVGELREALSKA